MDLAQIAVKAVANAIDHGRIGLQAHADAQAVDEHRGHHGPILGAAGFLFDDAGHDQHLVGVLVGQIGIAAGPGRFQLAVHGAHGQTQHRHVGGVFGVLVGIGEEQAFERAFLALQRLEQGLLVQLGRIGTQVIALCQRSACLAQVPALADAYLAQRKFAIAELAQQHARGVTGLDFVGAGLELGTACLPRQTQPP